MTNSRQLISAVFIVTLLLIASVPLSRAQEQSGHPDYKWLNGKWRGVWETPGVTDGSLVMNLQVVNDNQIKGSGVVTRPPRNQIRGAVGHTSISGSVKGNRVELVMSPGHTLQSRGYRLSHVDGALKGSRLSYVDGVLKTSRSGKEQIFNKIE